MAGAAIFRSSERSLPMVPVTMAVALLAVTSLRVMVMAPFATFPLPLQRSKRCRGVLVSWGSAPLVQFHRSVPLAELLRSEAVAPRMVRSLARSMLCRDPSVP